MKITKWRAVALALVTAALVAVVGLSTASATVRTSSAVTIVIWTDANRAPAVTKIADGWATSRRAPRSEPLTKSRRSAPSAWRWRRHRAACGFRPMSTRRDPFTSDRRTF